MQKELPKCQNLVVRIGVLHKANYFLFERAYVELQSIALLSDSTELMLNDA